MNRHGFVEGLTVLLAQRKLISPIDMARLHTEFAQQDGVAFEDFLLEQGIVEREDLLETLSQYYGVPQLDTVGTFFDHQFLRLLPLEVMLEHLVIPYLREEGSDTLWVVAADPSNPHILELLGLYVTHDIAFMVGLPQDIRDALREYYDESDTYQPNSIENQLMERSSGSVFTAHELDGRIPNILDATIDDYERD